MIILKRKHEHKSKSSLSEGNDSMDGEDELEVKTDHK